MKQKFALDKLNFILIAIGIVIIIAIMFRSKDKKNNN